MPRRDLNAVFACALGAYLSAVLPVGGLPLPLVVPSLPRLPLPLAVSPEGASSWVDGRQWEGEPLAADFPASDWIKNIGSHRDGAGMCVMSSIEMAARWSGLEDYRGLRDWCASEPGGGYPGKVDDQLKRFAAAKGFAGAPYYQMEGKPAEVAATLEWASRNGLMAAMTYGYSPRYGSRTIAHMTACPKFDGRFAVCMDNNAIGGVEPPDRLFEWMERDELVRRCCYPSGTGWVFVWLGPPPPPLPKNP